MERLKMNFKHFPFYCECKSTVIAVININILKMLQKFKSSMIRMHIADIEYSD